MSSWADATEEHMQQNGFCEYCGQVAEVLWVLEGDYKCSTCRQKEIDQGN